jgi:hypothetical protein
MGRLSAGSRRALMVVLVVELGLMIWLKERFLFGHGVELV